MRRLSGIVSVLVSVAHSGQAGARRDAALVLACLSLLPHTSAVASSSGAVEVMVAAAAQLCDSEVLESSSAAFEALVACEGGRSVIPSTAVASCVQLLSDESEAVYSNATFVLEQITTDAAVPPQMCAAAAATRAPLPRYSEQPAQAVRDRAELADHPTLDCAADLHLRPRVCALGART